MSMGRTIAREIKNGVNENRLGLTTNLKIVCFD